MPRAIAGALVALGLVGSVGACQSGPLGSRGDPAGHDLLADLLVKQGARVTSLPGSLGHLPMRGTAGPVVVLDADRVPLEAETRDHLVAWVKQGGVLVLAGQPSRWPPDFWAKPVSAGCEPGLAKVRVETRGAPAEASADDGDAEDDAPPSPLSPEVCSATLAHAAAMTWPNEDRAPRAIAHLASGELYGALRVFGEGRVLGLASADLLTNLGLAVPGNAAALIGMLATLDRSEFAIARSEQGIAPPSDPLTGLLHIGLGPALGHVAFFIPLLFLAYGTRQTAPRAAPSPRRRAFAEHVQAVGGLYARRRAATHALAVYAKHVDDRLRATMPRSSTPAQFLAARAGADPGETAELYARAMETKSGERTRGDELRVIERMAALYAKARR